MKSSHGLIMDGFMKGGATSDAPQSKIPKITEASNLLIPKAASDRLRTAAQGVHNRAQRSQTLMRAAVKKPAEVAKTANSNFKKVPDFKPRASLIDNSRLNRVQSIDRNQKVRRFGHGISAGMATSVQQKPEQKAEVGEIVSKQSSNMPAVKTPKSSSTSLIHKPLPSMVTSASHQQLERMLDEALTRADAHKKHRRGQLPNQSLMQKALAAPKWLSIGVSVVIASLIAGYIAMNKVPQVAVRIAAAKAHISAEVPGYTPAGFSFTNPVSYSDGKVSLKFKANDSSNREFTISQASSKMSSKSLQDKVVPDNIQVQTSVVNGTTVYIYGESNDAAWVNNGMQYTIKDAASLNSDQILKIANSL
jgi:hypothetical protein